MKSINLLGLAISLVRADAASDPYYTSNEVSAEVSPRIRELAAKPDSKNPVHLDALRNHLVPLSILSVFKSPRFTGDTPPGIKAFMTTQVFLSGQRRDGFSYPLFLRYAIEKFGGKNKNITIEDICTKGGKACPEGYKKVMLKDDKDEISKKNATEKVDVNTPRIVSPEGEETPKNS